MVSSNYSDFFVCIANWKEVVVYLHQKKERENRHLMKNKVQEEIYKKDNAFLLWYAPKLLHTQMR